MIYEIWFDAMIGSIDYGECYIHQKAGECEGTDFRNACDNFYKDPKHNGYYSSDRLSYWAHKLFPTQSEAKKYEDDFILENPDSEQAKWLLKQQSERGI